MAQPPAADAPAQDRQVWLACATPLSRLPSEGSQVYYFPHGHAEQCPDRLPAPLPIPHLFPCTVGAVELHADAESDEPYATISLVPGPHRDPPPAPDDANANAQLEAGAEGSLPYYAKTLTQSDANNGGGFSVPRFCADLVFPKLDYNDDPPLQNLTMRDLNGNAWEFRHIYRGTPRRHLLTTGWSKFVNAKLLVAGDAVVFMRRPNGAKGELLVGVRRSPRYKFHLAKEGETSLSARARVPPQEVMDAARLAAEGRPFTVTFYPRQGAGEFVVPRNEVEEALSASWEPGVQVHMKVVDAEDSRRSELINGTVKAVDDSIWRMLEIDWDGSPSASKVNRHVNAWQVDFVGYPPLLKKLKFSENIAPLYSGNIAMLADSLVGLETQNMAILLGSSIPAGMQGARHDGVTDVPASPAAMFSTQILFPGLQIPLSSSGGSSEVVNSDHGSPPNSSVNTQASDVPGKMRTIQLFGKTITSPVQSSANGSEEVIQVPDGVVDGTANEDASAVDGIANQDASATSPLDCRLSKDNAHSQDDSTQGA